MSSYSSLSSLCARERALGARASAEVSASWLPLLRGLAAESLRADACALRSQFEGDCARLDGEVVRLEAALALVASRRGAAGACARSELERVAGLQAGRLSALEAESERERCALEAEFERERGSLAGRAREARAQLAHVAAALRADERARDAAAASEHEQLREAHKRRNLERIQVLQSDMDGVIEGLERAFEAAHLAYLTATDGRTQDFKALSERGQHDTALNERQQRSLRRLNRLLQGWRTKMAASAREGVARNDALATERDALARHLEALKAAMARAREGTQARLRALCVAAGAAKAQLASHATLAQRILSMLQAVRPFETPADRAAGEGAPPVIADGAVVGGGVAAGDDGGGAAGDGGGAAGDGGDAAGGGGGDTSDAGGACTPRAPIPAVGSCDADHEHAAHTQDALALATALHPLHARLNCVQLDRHGLCIERARLRAEQALLRSLLRQHHDATKALPPLLAAQRLTLQVRRGGAGGGA